MTKDLTEKVQDYVKKSHNMTENEQKSEKTTQDVQKNCLSLTEQWKKGELEEGAYYVKLESGKIDIYFMVYDDDDCDEIVEILAEIPSYEKYKCLETGILLANALIKNTEDENAKLKELLKECRNCVTRQIYGSPTRQYWEGVFDDKLLTKIDEVFK